MFKCIKCGEKYSEEMCSDEDVAICQECMEVKDIEYSAGFLFLIEFTLFNVTSIFVFLNKVIAEFSLWSVLK